MLPLVPQDGVAFLPVDRNLPLEAQLPFDLLLHKARVCGHEHDAAICSCNQSARCRLMFDHCVTIVLTRVRILRSLARQTTAYLSLGKTCFRWSVWLQRGASPLWIPWRRCETYATSHRRHVLTPLQYVMDRTTLCQTLLGLQDMATGTATRVRGGPFAEVGIAQTKV